MHKSFRLSFLVWLAAALLSACSSVTPAPLETQAALTVTSEADSGPGSLREAIAQADWGDLITFDASVRTVTLVDDLYIDKDLTIAGPEGGSITISGNNSTRVFAVDVGATELRNLRITGGARDGSGSGIANFSTLIVIIQHHLGELYRFLRRWHLQ